MISLGAPIGIAFGALTGAPVLAIKFEDWGLVIFFVIAGIVRLIEMIRERAKKRAPLPEPEPAPDRPAPDRRPAPDPASGRQPPPLPDPWRRSPAPSEPQPRRSTPVASPSRPAPRPSSRRAVHQEGPLNPLVNLHDFRAGTPVAAGPDVGRAERQASRDAETTGRTLLRASPATTRDRLRAALLWREILDAPRSHRPHRPQRQGRQHLQR